VTVRPLCGNSTFDAIGLYLYQYAVKSLPCSFYKVQYEHNETSRCSGLRICVCFKFSGDTFLTKVAQLNRTKSDSKDIAKNNRGGLFLRHSIGLHRQIDTRRTRAEIECCAFGALFVFVHACLIPRKPGL